MIIDIIMPKMGESITEGTIIEWRKQVGDVIKKDETLLEIGTDKVDSEIPSTHSGTLVEILAEPNQVVEVGTPIARIEVPDEEVDGKGGGAKSEGKTAEKPPVTVEQKAVAPRSKKRISGKRLFTPVVMKIAREAGVSPARLESIPGTGRGGRVTKKDILRYLEGEDRAPERVVSPEAVGEPVPVLGVERETMSHMRRLIAEHMRRSLDTSAHVYVMTEVDMSRIVSFVSRHGPEFKAEEAFSLTYTPFIIAATVKALQSFPLLNASLEDDEIVYHKHINMGLAIALEKGLMVPVIPRCEELNFLGLCRKVNDLVTRTRKQRILPDELQGSTFSITNFGVFNITLGTPIINQPNVGILGVGTIKKHPVVIEGASGDAIGIRSVMFLSLGFDHRLVDGAGGSRFIDQVRKNLETMNLERLFSWQ